jgi:hypothetical protein
LEIGEPKEQISRRIYLGYPTAIFRSQDNEEFEILNKVSLHFNVPFQAVHIVGSAKTGFSFVERRPFFEKISDVDIAIIDARLFTSYFEFAHKQTKGFKDFTRYNSKTFMINKEKGISKSDKLRDDICQGYINPFYLPDGEMKDSWINFFEELSETYSNRFKDISGVVYTSQYLFEMKQYIAIEKYFKGGKKNVTI